MVYETYEHTCSFWLNRSMPEKGARVIGLEKDSELGLETVFRGDPCCSGSPLPLAYSVVYYAWQKYCKAAGVEEHEPGVGHHGQFVWYSAA